MMMVAVLLRWCTMTWNVEKSIIGESIENYDFFSVQKNCIFHSFLNFLEIAKKMCSFGPFENVKINVFLSYENGLFWNFLKLTCGWCRMSQSFHANLFKTGQWAIILKIAANFISISGSSMQE